VDRLFDKTDAGTCCLHYLRDLKTEVAQYKQHMASLAPLLNPEMYGGSLWEDDAEDGDDDAAKEISIAGASSVDNSNAPATKGAGAAADDTVNNPSRNVFEYSEQMKNIPVGSAHACTCVAIVVCVCNATCNFFFVSCARTNSHDFFSLQLVLNRASRRSRLWHR
jgi:hypothetical protein